MTPTNITEQLTRDEGVRLRVYRDSRGFDTIGIGHNCDANPLPFDVSQGITSAQAEQILQDDVNRITAQLLADIPWLTTLQQSDPVRFGVMTNMAFNLGVHGLLGFHHALSAVQTGNYAAAAIAMAASTWYTQVGARAHRLCVQMSTGVWV